MKSYIENFKKYRFLLWELVKKGVKLKYRRSYLGILWTLLEPLMTMIVLSVVFGTLFGNKDPHFPVYILCGRLMYSFFHLRQWCDESDQDECRNDQESICAKIYLSIIQCIV